MAFYSAVPPPEEYQSPSAPRPPSAQRPPSTPGMRKTSTGIDIDAWTISALESLNVSPVARGTGTPLTIPIDERRRTVKTPTGETKTVQFDRGTPSPPLPPRRPPSRRDSLVKREALLKGKEGSRQRRRWENDRLIGVPNAQPPQPTDWEVKPTHPVRRMPYQLAQFWDRGVRQLVEDKTKQLQATRKKQQLQSGSATGLGVGEVPRDLRESAKRSPIVKSWVRALEEPVRQFIYDEKAHTGGQDVKDEELDSEDEEIVFAGRSAAKHKTRMVRTDADNGAQGSGMVFDSFGDDEGASFKRWLTHSISDYYGLESRSVTLAHSSLRVVYVGFKQTRQGPAKHLVQLPRPLWEVC